MDAASRLLLSGERVLWEGKPSTGLILRPIDVFLIPFSLMWGGFALFWNLSVWMIDTDGGDLLFKIWGLPFLIVGIYITVGRFWIDMRQRQRLTYLVTDHRILIVKQGSSSTTKSVDIKRLPSLELEERRDGTGTICFGTSSNWFGRNNFGIWQPSLDPTPQFIRIENARKIYELIEEQAR